LTPQRHYEPDDVSAIPLVGDGDEVPGALAAQMPSLLETDAPVGKQEVCSVAAVTLAGNHPPPAAISSQEGARQSFTAPDKLTASKELPSGENLIRAVKGPCPLRAKSSLSTT
jgi:hypothetical protein